MEKDKNIIEEKLNVIHNFLIEKKYVSLKIDITQYLL
jgi:hypothetical protein